MRALAAGFLLAVMPAAAQWKVPDNLPALPPDGAACNEKSTHCLVNFADWMGYQVALQMAARKLVDQAELIESLSRQLEAEHARGPHCAEVRKIPVPDLKRSSFNGGAP